MIEISYRTDLNLTLIRLFDRVCLTEHLEALRVLMIEAEAPPMDHLVLIDGRRVLDYDLSTAELMRLGIRVATLYLFHPRPMNVLVLADQDWQWDIIRKFQIFARASGRITVTPFTEESSLLRAARIEAPSLDALFPRDCLRGTFRQDRPQPGRNSGGRPPRA